VCARPSGASQWIQGPLGRLSGYRALWGVSVGTGPSGASQSVQGPLCGCIADSGVSMGKLARLCMCLFFTRPSGRLNGYKAVRASQWIQGRQGCLSGYKAVRGVSVGSRPSGVSQWIQGCQGRLSGFKAVRGVSVGIRPSKASQWIQGRLRRLSVCKAVSSINAKVMHNSGNLIFICTRPGLVQAHTILFVS